MFERLLDLPDLLHHARALVEQREDAQVELVDAVAGNPRESEVRSSRVMCVFNSKPCFSSRASDSSCSRQAKRSPALRSIRRTKALPTTTASASRPPAGTCSGVEMPKPTASGRSVTSRMDATSGPTRARERLALARSRRCVKPGRRSRVEYFATSFSRRGRAGGRGQEHGVEAVRVHRLDVVVAPPRR